MNYFIFTIGLLLSASSAIACPNLAATYKCPNARGMLIIEQEKINRTTVYTINDKVFHADKKTRGVQDEEVIINTKAYCKRKSLIVEEKIPQVVLTKVLSSYTQKGKSEIVVSEQTSVEFQGVDIEEPKIEFTCVKITQ